MERFPTVAVDPQREFTGIGVVAHGDFLHALVCQKLNSRHFFTSQ